MKYNHSFFRRSSGIFFSFASMFWSIGPIHWVRKSNLRPFRQCKGWWLLWCDRLSIRTGIGRRLWLLRRCSNLKIDKGFTVDILQILLLSRCCTWKWKHPLEVVSEIGLIHESQIQILFWDVIIIHWSISFSQSTHSTVHHTGRGQAQASLGMVWNWWFSKFMITWLIASAANGVYFSDWLLNMSNGLLRCTGCRSQACLSILVVWNVQIRE